MATTTKITCITKEARIKGIKNAVFDRLSGKLFEELDGAEYSLLTWMMGDSDYKPDLSPVRQAKVARTFQAAYESVPDAARLPKGTLPGAETYIAILKQGARVNRNRQAANAVMAQIAGHTLVDA